MSTRKAVLATVAYVAGWVALAATILVASANAGARCHEDQACWTWSKMGNHTRGVVTMHGTPLIVGPCRFARLHASGDVEWSVTLDGVVYPQNERLRGDWWALRHGCDR